MILADQCVPGAVVEALRRLGHEVAWMRDIEPTATDVAVLGAAEVRHAILLTRDKDFGELALVRRLPTSGVILYRLVATPIPAHAAVLTRVIGTDLTPFIGQFSVVTEHAVRRRPLPGRS